MPEMLFRAIRTGIASVRENFVPMIVLLGLAVALTAGYYALPGVSAALTPLARWQSDNGWPEQGQDADFGLPDPAVEVIEGVTDGPMWTKARGVVLPSETHLSVRRLAFW